MSKIKQTGIEYKGTVYPVVFNLNVMELIQDAYGTVEKWGELTDAKKGEINVKALKFGITAMLNEGVDEYNEEHEDKREFFTEKTVGRIISELGLQQMAETMNNTVIESTKSDEKNA